MNPFLEITKKLPFNPFSTKFLEERRPVPLPSSFFVDFPCKACFIASESFLKENVDLHYLLILLINKK